MKLALLAGLLLLCAPHARAGFTAHAQGTSTAEFLELGAGARGNAMGGAYSAVADGADALYWNPAGLGLLKGGEATLMHAPYIDSSYYEYGSLGFEAGPGAAAASFQYFSAGAVNQTDTSGAIVGTLTPSDLAVAGGYGLALDSEGPLGGAAAGVSAKFIQSHLLTQARTGAADAGILSPPLMDGRLRLSLSARNIGSTMKFEQVHEELPTTAAIGAAFKLARGWLLSGQADFPRDGAAYASAGMEYRWPAAEGIELQARAGLTTRALVDVPGLIGLTGGAGIAWRFASIDYAFVPMGDLGMTHRVSVSLRWGGRAKTLEKAAPSAEAIEREWRPSSGRAPAGNFDQQASDAKGSEAVHDWSEASDQWAEAEGTLEPSDPRRVGALVRLGEARSRAGDEKGAMAAYKRAIDTAKRLKVSDKTVIAAWVGLAQQQAAARQRAAALKSYRKALELTNDAALRERIEARMKDVGALIP